MFITAVCLLFLIKTKPLSPFFLVLALCLATASVKLARSERDARKYWVLVIIPPLPGLYQAHSFWSSLFGGVSSAYKGERGISLAFSSTFSGLITVQMSDPETPPKKRKVELDGCDEENPKKSKTECSSAPVESPGQENIEAEDTHFTGETLADTTSEEAKEVDKDQV